VQTLLCGRPRPFDLWLDWPDPWAENWHTGYSRPGRTFTLILVLLRRFVFELGVHAGQTDRRTDGQTDGQDT